MGSATQLYRIAVLDDAHMVTILFTEECHSAHLFGLVDRHFTMFLTRYRLTNHLVGKVLDLTDLLGRHLAEVREVET